MWKNNSGNYPYRIFKKSMTLFTGKIENTLKVQFAVHFSWDSYRHIWDL